ncbi:MAG: hypothetical protein GX295_05180 [Syntrophomonadaceae bacterium]|nr:hypothetical protein [Syntrophomonadaceae bacterium]
MLEEEAENYRQKNEELNPKLKIYTGEISPNPEEVAFTKGDFQIFEVHYEYELR